VGLSRFPRSQGYAGLRLEMATLLVEQLPTVLGVSLAC
jgi:hypothetical protein